MTNHEDRIADCIQAIAGKDPDPLHLYRFLAQAVQRHRAIKFRYLGPTDTNGAKVMLQDTWNLITVGISYDNKYNDVISCAVAYLCSKDLGPSISGIVKFNPTSVDYDTILLSSFDMSIE
jgi:hypothetical protein